MLLLPVVGKLVSPEDVVAVTDCGTSAALSVDVVHCVESDFRMVSKHKQQIVLGNYEQCIFGTIEY